MVNALIFSSRCSSFFLAHFFLYILLSLAIADYYLPLRLTNKQFSTKKRVILLIPSYLVVDCELLAVFLHVVSFYRSHSVIVIVVPISIDVVLREINIMCFWLLFSTSSIFVHRVYYCSIIQKVVQRCKFSL